MCLKYSNQPRVVRFTSALITSRLCPLVHFETEILTTRTTRAAREGRQKEAAPGTGSRQIGKPVIAVRIAPFTGHGCEAAFLGQSVSSILDNRVAAYRENLPGFIAIQSLQENRACSGTGPECIFVFVITARFNGLVEGRGVPGKPVETGSR